MFSGYNHDGEERHLIEFDDGCALLAEGIDRTDAQAKAEAAHEGCQLHTEACRMLQRMIGETVALTMFCSGECNLTDEEVWKLLSPPCTELSVAGRRRTAEATR